VLEQLNKGKMKKRATLLFILGTCSNNAEVRFPQSSSLIDGKKTQKIMKMKNHPTSKRSLDINLVFVLNLTQLQYF
jgi:hypothetical protein